MPSAKTKGKVGNRVKSGGAIDHMCEICGTSGKDVQRVKVCRSSGASAFMWKCAGC